MINRLPLYWIVLLLPQTAAGQLPLQLQPGLQAAYYRGQDFQHLVYKTTDVQLNFAMWQRIAVPGLPLEGLAVRWSGYLYVPVTGKYRFDVAASTGLRLWLDDQLLLGDQSYRQAHVAKAARQLAGHTFYRLRVERLSGPLTNQALLTWVRPDARPLYTLFAVGRRRKTTAPVAIPAAYFYSDLPDPCQPVITLELPLSKNQTRALVAAVQPPSSCLPAANPMARASVVANPGTSAHRSIGSVPPLYFEQGQARLLRSSQLELPGLALLLREQPALRLHLLGYTDNLGDAQLNKVLSQQRAETVRDYLLRQGITSDRITAIGYGGQQPAAKNTDANQRARNRRVEVLLL